MTKFVAVDIETTGLYPKPKSKIWCIAINDGKKITVHENIESARKLLEDPNIVKVIHNAAFDCFWLLRLHGINTVNIWDTMLCEQVILGDIIRGKNIPEAIQEKYSSNLKYTLKRYGLANLKKELGETFATRLTAKLTTDELEYVKDDVRYLLQLQAMQEYRLTKLDLMRVANLENKVVERVVNMRNLGIGVNTGAWLAIETNNKTEYNHILKRLPPRVSNWNSPAQVKKYFTSIGIPIQSFDEITDDFVNKYNNPMLNQFVRFRALSTEISKYGVNFLTNSKTGESFVDEYDGRLHADFHQIQNTGRFSVSNPPLHGLPREGQQRSAIVPRKGHVFIDGDFSGQEIGIMAAASGEELWIKALLRGDDPLSLMGSILFVDWASSTQKDCTFPKKCKCEKHKYYRQASKEITYGIAYGAYPKSISEKIGQSVKDTTRLVNKFKRTAPKLTRWLDTNARNTVKTRVSYSADIYKRRRVVRDPEDWMVRNVGYNNPVQACGANMCKVAMISMPEKTPLAFVWHDALILEVPKSKAKAAQKMLKQVMEKAADYCTGIPGLIKASPVIALSLDKKDIIS